jgi:hypothetical protein
MNQEELIVENYTLRQRLGECNRRYADLQGQYTRRVAELEALVHNIASAPTAPASISVDREAYARLDWYEHQLRAIRSWALTGAESWARREQKMAEKDPDGITSGWHAKISTRYATFAGKLDEVLDGPPPEPDNLR